MIIIWIVEGLGTGREIVRDSEHAAGVLHEVARDLYPDPSEAADFVLSWLAPLRLALTTEGERAVRNGEAWRMRSGPLRVMFLP